MELISGIISGILLLTLLIVLPFGLRARRRDLKEVAQLGFQLENTIKSLVKAMESLVGEKEGVEPSAGKVYSMRYRDAYIKVNPRADVFSFVKDAETRFHPSEAFLGEIPIPFGEEFFFVAREEPSKVFKIEIAWEPKDIEETIGNFFAPPYSLVDKERAYAR